MSHAERPAVSPVKIIVPHANDRLYDVAQTAVRESMHLISDGKQVILCSVIPVGWKKFAVKERPDNQKARLTGHFGDISALSEHAAGETMARVVS